MPLSRAVYLTTAVAGTLVSIAVPHTFGAQGPSGEADLSFDARYSGEGHAVEDPTAKQGKLQRSLGDEAVVSLDPATGTPRVVADRDGSLTPPVDASPAAIALDYARHNDSVFGLASDEIDSLKLARSYRSNGITHLIWGQQVDGVPVFQADLRASVADDGRLMTIGGAPVADLATSLPTPELGAAQAIRKATAGIDVDSGLGAIASTTGRDQLTTFRGGSTASLVLFPDPDDGAVLAWRTLLPPDSPQLLDAVVDASSGNLLRLEDRVDQAAGLAYDYYPGASVGGTQTSKPFSTSGNDPWLTGTSQLKGNNAWAYTDIQDNIFTQVFEGSGPTPLPGQDDLIPPSSGSDWNYAQTTVTSENPAQLCPPSGCTWAGWDDPEDAFSWEQNLEQAGTQAFFFANNFHDHLRDAPGIAFTEASGNFEQVNSSGKGEGNDPVHIQVVDGADTHPFRDGFPDNTDPAAPNQNNGNAATFRDGYSMRMQLYLWSDNGAEELGMEPGVVRDVNGADTAALVYHEYAHGLSNRLITDSAGDGALDGPQSDAMGEAWSDWYATDYLVDEGLQPDTAANGELWTMPYVGIQPTGGSYRGRSEAMDCPVGSSAPACPGSNWGDEFEEFDEDAGPGGYTYGDFARVRDIGAQVHHDGEIWGQTLWDLRTALIAEHGEDQGMMHARALITESMRMAPVNPTYLDVRDMILVADSALGLGDHALIWDVFAERGMGVGASTDSSFDTFPVEDFEAPTDTQAPETTIQGVKVNRKKRSAKATFVGTDPGSESLPLSFRCRVDAKPFAGCASPTTFKGLKPGNHSIEVVAYDAVLHGDPTPALETFKVRKP